MVDIGGPVGLVRFLEK